MTQRQRQEPRTRARRAADCTFALAFAFAGFGSLAACISAPDTAPRLPPMCKDSSGCDQASGEVCDEGVCWGGPPTAASFAAVLTPPPERADLPVTVLPLLSIASDGTIAGLDFPESVAVHGRVLLACPDDVGTAPYPCGDQASVGAQILVERAPGFAGGPAYSRTVVAAAGVGPAQDAFSFLLPRDPDAEYRITIQPDDTVGGEEIAPGEIAPPRQLVVSADRDQRVDWAIGRPAELETIRGCVENAAGDGRPYAGMQVVGFGRWTELSPLERASSRSLTGADGCFELSVPRNMLDQFDISVAPAPDVILPSLTLFGEFVRDPAEGEQAVHVIDPPLVMPAAPAPTTFRLPVEVQGSAGGRERVVGADVRLTTVFTPPELNQGHQVEISFSAQAVTSGADDADPGVASVQLYPGDENNRRYRVSVLPPPGSQSQSVFDQEIDVGIGGAQVLQALTLERRTAVTAVAVDQDGDPVADALIETRPSSLFRQLLGQEALEKVVAELPVSTATTNPNGSLLLWLDRVLVGHAASYDIEVTPPLLSGAPSWSFEDEELPSSSEPLDLGKLELPHPSYARAVVRDPGGQPVPAAQLRIYQLPPDDYCTVKKVDPAKCEPPARLRGVWASDSDGMVRVVLPDP